MLFGLRAHGRRNVPREGGVILAANHASFLDPIAVGCALGRPADFLARQTLFDVPGLGFLLSRIRVHPVKRGEGDVRAMRRAIALVKQGACLLVFPEGTRTSDGQIQALRAGVGILARHTEAPVVPTWIEGSFKAWPRSRAFPVPEPVTVWFEEAIPPGGEPERIAAAVRDAWEHRQQALRV